MSSVLLVFCYFVLFFFYKSKNYNVKILTLLGSVVLFSGGFAFVDHPKIAAMHVTLYGFLACVFFVFRGNYRESLSQFPIKKSFFFLLLTFLASGFLGEEGGINGMYSALRFFLDSYGFLLVGFILGCKSDYDELFEKFFWPIMVFCFCGFIEALFQFNFVYTWLIDAFPVYDGYLVPGSPDMNFFDSWRIRTSITTLHPTTLGALLTSIFIFCLPKKDSGNVKDKILLLVLVVAIFLSGSRSAWVCCALYLLFYYLQSHSVIVKIALIFACIGGVFYAGNYFVESFSEEGRGSSLDMRQRNFLVCAISFSESPVLGHGFNYIGSLVERDDDGRAIDGAMESVLYNLLVEQGLVGLLSYLGFVLICLNVFRKMRKHNPNVAGIGGGITIMITLFSLMSGTLGNLHSMAYILEGSCLGMLCSKTEEEVKPDEE